VVPFGPHRFDGPAIIPYIVPYPVFVGSANSIDPNQVGADDPSDPPYSLQTPNTPLTMKLQEPIPPPIVLGQREKEPEQGASQERPCQAGSTAREDQLDHFLVFIALKDSRVYTAVAYWVQGQTLHYITADGSHNQVSLDLVDRNLSARLNAGRLVELVLAP